MAALVRYRQESNHISGNMPFNLHTRVGVKVLEGSVTAKCKQCTQIIAGSTKVTSISVKHLKVRISSLFTCHFY